MSGSVVWKGWSTVDKPVRKKKHGHDLKKVPADARKTALAVLSQAEESGQDLSALLNSAFAIRELDRRDQALVTELVYGVFRQRGFLDWQIDQFSRVKKVKRPTRFILRLALYQLLFLDRIPAYAAVNAAVNQTKTADGLSGSRFVNGLLRSILRLKNQLPEPDQANRLTYLSVMTSHPEWMVQRWLARFGEEKTRILCRGNNEAPPMTLRVNRLKTTRDKLLEELISADTGSATATHLSSEGVIVKGLSVAQMPSFKRGEFYIQDEGAQLTAYLVNPQAGEHILDVCAAPGGKATHLAELSNGKALVTATDLHPDRLALLQENIDRLETPGVRIEKMDCALSAGRLYDKILVDAPCSALGILRRIPEGKWSKKSALIQSAAGVQLEILEKILPYLKVGGRLIYVTCSTEWEENESVVEVFSKEHKELMLENPSLDLPLEARRYIDSQGYFTTAFNSDSMDRFFAVRWTKDH